MSCQNGVAVFIDSAFLPAIGVPFGVNGCVDFSNGIQPVSISGQINVDPNPFVDRGDSGDFSNHCSDTTFTRETVGWVSKVFVPNGDPAPANAQQDPQITFDFRVNTVVPGQFYESRVQVVNSRSESFDYVACEKLTMHAR